MIVGHGDLASVLGPFDRPEWTLFAAGVSNSGETDERQYEREKALLREQDRNTRLIYFSSLSVFYADTRYTRHKRLMEHLVASVFPYHTIVRIGNITWGDNPHTLINFFRQQFRDGTDPVIRNLDRFIVDEDEFLYWVSMIPEFNCEINVPGKRMKVQEVWDRYVGHRMAVCPI